MQMPGPSDPQQAQQYNRGKVQDRRQSQHVGQDVGSRFQRIPARAGGTGGSKEHWHHQHGSANSSHNSTTSITAHLAQLVTPPITARYMQGSPKQAHHCKPHGKGQSAAMPSTTTKYDM